MSAPATRYDPAAKNSAPFVVRDASAGVCLFQVPVRSAQALLPGNGLRAVATRPGAGLVGLAFLDVREGSIEPHRQVAFLVAASPASRSTWFGAFRGAIAVTRRRVPFHVFQHPVGHEAARSVGAEVFGLPSSLHSVDVRYEPARAQCELMMHGRHVLTLSMPRGGRGTFDTLALEGTGHSDGVALRTRGTCNGAGVTEGGRQVELLLGDHPLADRLRRIGMPKRPTKSVYVETLRARFGAPLRGGAPHP
jgi:hypothetical protein